MNTLSSNVKATTVYLATFSKTAYKRLRDALLSEYAANVVVQMSENETYVNFAAKVADLQSALGDYDKALQIVIKGGSKPQYEQKNIKKGLLLDVMDSFEKQMNFEAEGDPNFILNAGFDCWLQRTRTIIVPPPTPRVVSLLADPLASGVVKV